MKKFTAPLMEIQKLVPEDVFTGSDDCSTEAQGCGSCYCSAVVCPDKCQSDNCSGCYDDWG